MGAAGMSLLERLARVEEEVHGEAQNGAMRARIDALERLMLGATRTGAVLARLSRLEEEAGTGTKKQEEALDADVAQVQKAYYGKPMKKPKKTKNKPTLSAEDEELARELRKWKPEYRHVKGIGENWGETPLHEAARDGDLELVQQILRCAVFD